MRHFDSMEILNELLKFQSITPDDDGAFNYISMILNDFEEINIDKNGVKNVIFRKTFGPGVHICFAGHIDVVKPGIGWDSDPFDPLQKDGFIYARGAQDMKSAVAAMICAVSGVQNFNGTISLLLTSDEEGDAVFGTREALKFLQSRGELPDFAVVGEPTCETVFGDTIKVGRRGSINGILRINGIQGHVAYPNKCVNPVHILASKFANFAGHDFDSGNDFFEPSKLVVVDIRGGMQVCNVTPSDVSVMFNVRNSNLTDANDIKNFINDLYKDCDFDLNLKVSSNPFLTDKNSKIVQKLSQSVQKISGVCPAFTTGGGTSDARYFAEFNVDVAEFGVINDRLHAINERVSVNEVQKLTEIYKDLIENF